MSIRPPAAAAAASPGVLAVVKYASSNTYTTSSATLVDVDATNAKITFSAPASGNVLVTLNGENEAATGNNSYWGLRDGGGIVAGTQTYISNGNQANRLTAQIYLTGLTPGTSYTYKWAFSVNAGGTLNIYASATEQLVMKVETCP